MSDRATPNLPSRDFQATADFYGRLGFQEVWRDEGWMILRSGAVVLEFFPHAEPDPATSVFGCCLRLDDVQAFAALCRRADVAEGEAGQPRLHTVADGVGGRRATALVDPDGSLCRLIQNAAAE